MFPVQVSVSWVFANMRTNCYPSVVDGAASPVPMIVTNAPCSTCARFWTDCWASLLSLGQGLGCHVAQSREILKWENINHVFLEGENPDPTNRVNLNR